MLYTRINLHTLLEFYTFLNTEITVKWNYSINQKITICQYFHSALEFSLIYRYTHNIVLLVEGEKQGKQSSGYKKILYYPNENICLGCFQLLLQYYTILIRCLFLQCKQGKKYYSYNVNKAKIIVNSFIEDIYVYPLPHWYLSFCIDECKITKVIFLIEQKINFN